MQIPDAWGRVYAVLHRLTKGGLSPADVTQGAACPGMDFGRLHARVAKRMPDWAQKRLIELLNHIDPDDMQRRLTLEEQGQWFLGYYHEQARLQDEAMQAINGRPKKGEIDWSGVDWGKSNADIARDLDVSRQAVSQRRARENP